MIIVMKKSATMKQTKQLADRIQNLGYYAHLSRNDNRTFMSIACAGDLPGVDEKSIDYGIDRVVKDHNPYVLASREFKTEPSVITVGDVKIGGKKVTIIAGQWKTVESYEQCLETAKAAKAYGAGIFNGGIYQSQISSCSLRGIGLEELKILALVKEKVGLPIAIEVMSADDIEPISEYADIIQVGGDNMQNFSLLKQVGKCSVPVILKRGLMSTVKEFLMSAEYILSGGNSNVILCERGIRTFETSTRNTPDLVAIPIIKELSHLPVIFDPCHSTGKRELVSPMSAAALACGADGIIVEIQSSSANASYVNEQSLTCDLFAAMMQKLRQVVIAIDKAV